MARLGTPIVTVVIGEGGSGGALGIGVGNRVYMMENAIYSVISPESCAAIIWRDSSHAEKAAVALKLTAMDLMGLGLIDGVIAEPGEGAHSDPDAAAASLSAAVSRAFDELSNTPPQELVEERYQKFRRMGSFFEEIPA